MEQINISVIIDYNKNGYNIISMMRELPISVSEIKQLFQIPISKVKLSQKLNNYHEVVTAYGNMRLVLQHCMIPQQNSQLLRFIQHRNKLMAKEFKAFLFIYQQHTIIKRQSLICLTLTEQCIPLQIWQSHNSNGLRPVNFAKLIECVNVLQKQKLILQPSLSKQNLLYLPNSEQVFLDFTHIQPITYGNQQNNLFTNLVILITAFLQQKYNTDSKIHQVIFIKGNIYAFAPQKIKNAQNCFQLLLFFNIDYNLQVELVSKSINNNLKQRQTNENSQQQQNKQNNNLKKKVQVKNLQNYPLIKFEGVQYSKFYFEEGKCLNCLRQIKFEQLATKFIKDHSLYKLQQFQHLIVQRSQNHNRKNAQQEVMTVYPPVSKAQLISFLLAYIGCVNPILNSIQYLTSENTLRLSFDNRKNIKKVLNIVFYKQYVVKDQEISMILEKSILFSCKLNLKNMRITDSLLVFLSHLQKAKDITHLQLDDKYGLTELGFTTYLKSPFSNELKTICITSINEQNGLITEQAIQNLSQKRNLQRIYIRRISNNNNFLTEQLKLSQLKLLQLSLIGYKVNIGSMSKNNIKILRLDQFISIDELKNIKNLPLVELKIRLYEIQKKSLMQSLAGGFSSLSLSTSFSNKTDSIKLFAQGEVRKTLKHLDISRSNCKFKTLGLLFKIVELQTIILDYCTNIGTDFETVSENVLSISLESLQIDIQQLRVLIMNSMALVELNICNTKIGKHDIGKLVKTNKININNLIITEIQYSNKILESTNGFENINCIELFIDRLLQAEQQFSINYIIMKATSSKKTFRFRVANQESERDFQDDEGEVGTKKQLLIQKIKKYLIISSSNIQSLSNIYINKMKVTDLLQIQQDFQVEDICQSKISSSIVMGANKCRIISIPKIIVRKNNLIPVYFRLLQNETIDKVTHRFVKFMQSNVSYLCIDLSGNKLVGKSVINMFHQFGKNLIRELDFRGCLFSFDEVIETLFEFSKIDHINGGQYSIYLNKQNFAYRSERYLRLFMHSAQIKKLHILCQQIQQVQILFSVLSHIADQISSTIQSLSISLMQIKFNKQSEHFFYLIFKLKNIIQFDLIIKDCCIQNQNCALFEKINQFAVLQRIKLSLPSNCFPSLTLRNLNKVQLEFNDGLASQKTVYKSIKNLEQSKDIKKFSLSLANCIQITNVMKILGVLPIGCVLQKLNKLEYLDLNFQYCSLKQQPLFQLLDIIPKCQNLKKLQLNVSFAIQNFNDFGNCIEKMVQQFTKPINAKIICVTQSSRNYGFRTDSMCQKGIQFII